MTLAAAHVPVRESMLSDPLTHRAADNAARKAFTALAKGRAVRWDTMRHVQTITAADADEQVQALIGGRFSEEWSPTDLVILRYTVEVDEPVSAPT